MNLFATMRSQLAEIVAYLYPDSDAAKLTLEPPKDASHGDMATNAAMILAKQVGQKPRDIAEALKPRLEALGDVEQVDIAGPGFINIRLRPAVWQSLIAEILAAPEHYGESDIGRQQKVNIEYVSVNPTGPMHVGHARQVYGDALASILIKAGYDVTREYYVNDAGAQMDKLAESAYLRYRQACGEVINEIPEGLYPGDYLVPVGESLKAEHGSALLDMPREKWLPLVRDFAGAQMLELIKDDLAFIGVHHDVFTSEAAIVAAGRTEEALGKLADKGLIYEGVLDPPKGKTPDDWEPTKQTLFKSTDYGDDCDRAVKKSDGSWAYFAPDIAYHYDKMQRGATRLIDVMGADHGGYVKRITAAVRALGEDKATLEVKLCQLVKFMRGGEPLKMSKRAGTFITIREVAEEVGKDAFRFMMLTRKNDAPLDFDFDVVKEQTRDNPIFYVQYAHARAKSVLRHAQKDFAEAVTLANSLSLREMAGVSVSNEETPNSPLSEGEGILSHLSSPEELILIKAMANWPRVVEAAAIAAEPHRVTIYLQELAGAFHSLWNKGQGDLTLRFLQKDAIEETAARIAMVRAFAATIASALDTLGVAPLEEL